MAGYLNKVQLIGNVGQDPKFHSFQSGGEAANFTMATTENWKDKQTGERQSRTEWHTVNVTNQGLIGVIRDYVKKGSKLFVEGQLRTRKWTDKEGMERYATEVVLPPYRGELILLTPRGDGQGARSGRGSYSDEEGRKPAVTGVYEEDDETPF